MVNTSAPALGGCLWRASVRVPGGTAGRIGILARRPDSSHWTLQSLLREGLVRIIRQVLEFCGGFLLLNFPEPLHVLFVPLCLQGLCVFDTEHLRLEYMQAS